VAGKRASLTARKGKTKMDIRKYGIAIAVAILTAILIYSIADAFAPQVSYDDCYGKGRYASPVYHDSGRNCSVAPVDREAEKSCTAQGYSYEPVYDSYGCVESYTCETCYKEQDDKRQQRSMVIFYVMLVLGLVAIVAGFLLPLGTVHEWVGLGFIIGGVISLFIGTALNWSEIARWLRPIVIALELAVLLFIIYRRVGVQQAGGKPVENEGNVGVNQARENTTNSVAAVKRGKR
jgi:hypothetical protein